jgi:hypothetical protein
MKRLQEQDVKERLMFGEQRSRFSLRVTLVVLAFLAGAGAAFSASGCGTDTHRDAANGDSAAAETTAGRKTLSREITAEDFDPGLFDETSITIDNEWWPLEPGTQFVWRGSTEEDGERVPHRIVFTVTDLTKVINGVRTVVGWDRDFSAGQLIESELIFLAQDKEGNVWHFGQYSETWEGKELVGGQVWLVGHLKGAKAGILMKAQPRLGTPAYSEGFAPPPFYWDDYAKVDKMGQRTCVPAGCFEDVLVTDEFEPTKPGAHQLKYYARGVGNVRTGWRGRDADKEVLVLQKVVRLSREGLAKARAEALKLETRASVYGRTPPAQPRGGEGQ